MSTSDLPQGRSQPYGGVWDHCKCFAMMVAAFIAYLIPQKHLGDFGKAGLLRPFFCSCMIMMVTQLFAYWFHNHREAAARRFALGWGVLGLTAASLTCVRSFAVAGDAQISRWLGGPADVAFGLCSLGAVAHFAHWVHVHMKAGRVQNSLPSNVIELSSR